MSGNQSSTKTCYKCNVTHPCSEFYGDITRPDGLSNRCKDCARRYFGWNKRQELPERFWNRVDQTGECWLWLGSVDKDGYGKSFLLLDGRRKYVRAHVLAFYLTHGIFPAPFCLHTCDNPPCCRPEHLFAGTNKDNVQDSKHKGRRAKQHGPYNPQAKLTEQDIRDIRFYAQKGVLQSTIAQDYVISPKTVSKIVTRRRWRHVT